MLGIALGFGLSLGALDVGCSLLFEPPALEQLLYLFPPLGMATLTFGLLYSLVWTVCSKTVGKLLRLAPSGLALGLAVYIGFSFVLATYLDLLHLYLITNFLPPLGLVLLGAIVPGTASYHIGKRAKLLDGNQTVAAFLVILVPTLLLGGMFLLWYWQYRLAVTPLGLSLAVLLGVLLVMAGVSWLAWRGRRRGMPVGTLTISTVLVWICSGAALLFGMGKEPAVPPHPVTAPHPRHVILITIDNLRADALSVYNSDWNHTPHLDSLARDAVVFRRAVSTAPWTLPSVASILTGLSPAVHMVTRPEHRLPDDVHTLAEYMQERGYMTAAIGSNFYLRWPFNLTQGFVHYEMYPDPLGRSVGARLLMRLLPSYFNPSTGGLTSFAIEWLRFYREHEFFLWIHYLDPHAPYDPPREFLEGWQTTDKLQPPLMRERERVRGLYRAEVRLVDKHVGMLLEALKELGLYKDALIVATSDHGEQFWEHGAKEHGLSLYNEVLHVPLIVKLPQSAVRGEVSPPVSTAAVTPTILDLCEVPHDLHRFSYRSLAPYWKDEKAVNGQTIYITAVMPPDWQEAILFGRFKYVSSHSGKHRELYDLVEDWEERRSLAASHPEVVDRAEELLRRENKAAAQLRMKLGVRKEERVKAAEALRALRALGYIH